MTRSRRLRRTNRRTAYHPSAYAPCSSRSRSCRPTAANEEQQARTAASSAAARPDVAINRTVPRVSPPATTPLFSAPPTDDELRRARVFSEPLVLIGRSAAADNQALAAGVTRYVAGGEPLAVEPFTEFLAQHPASGWRASVLANVGALHRRGGSYLRALKAWDEAWTLTQDDTSLRQHLDVLPDVS